MAPSDPPPAPSGSIPDFDTGLVLQQAASILPDAVLAVPLLLLLMVLLAAVLRCEALVFGNVQPVWVQRSAQQLAQWFAAVVALTLLLLAAIAGLLLPIAAALVGMGLLPARALPMCVVVACIMAGLAFGWSRRPVEDNTPAWPAQVLAVCYWLLLPLTYPLALAIAAFQPRAQEPREEQPETGNTAPAWDAPDLLNTLLALQNIPVHNIMRPRIVMQGLDIAWSQTQVTAAIQACGYSRLPVYEGSTDNIRGILYAKDLLPLLDNHNATAWRELVRPTLFVPETKRVHHVLADFKEKRQHMAIVVDEFGGVAGLVTLQDILDEIFGDISDGNPTAANPAYHQVDAYTYIFDGRTTLTDLSRILHLPDTTFAELRAETDSVAGLLLALLGSLPTQGQSVQLGGLLLTAEQVGPRAVSQVRVSYVAVPEARSTGRNG